MSITTWLDDWGWYIALVIAGAAVGFGLAVILLT